MNLRAHLWSRVPRAEPRPARRQAQRDACFYPVRDGFGDLAGLIGNDLGGSDGVGSGRFEAFGDERGHSIR